jgi:hypothetical protein
MADEEDEGLYEHMFYTSAAIPAIPAGKNDPRNTKAALSATIGVSVERATGLEPAT